MNEKRALLLAVRVCLRTAHIFSINRDTEQRIDSVHIRRRLRKRMEERAEGKGRGWTALHGSSTDRARTVRLVITIAHSGVMGAGRAFKLDLTTASLSWGTTIDFCALYPASQITATHCDVDANFLGLKVCLLDSSLANTPQSRRDAPSGK